jgi:hypothetical protein
MIVRRLRYRMAAIIIAPPMSKTQAAKSLLEVPPIRCAKVKEYCVGYRFIKKHEITKPLKVAQISRVALVPQVALA